MGLLLLECCNFTEPVKMQNPKPHLRISMWRARNVHFSSNPDAANLQNIPGETLSSAKGKNEDAFSYSLPGLFFFSPFLPLSLHSSFLPPPPFFLYMQKCSQLFLGGNKHL